MLLILPNLICIRTNLIDNKNEGNFIQVSNIYGVEIW